MKIFIIDDNSSLAEALSESLQIEAHSELGIKLNVKTWKSPVKAIKAYEKEKPSIVLVDMVMQPLNGIQTTQEIKKINPEAKVYIITAFDDPENLDEALDIGVKHIFRKPVMASDIFKVISNELPSKEKETIMEFNLKKNLNTSTDTSTPFPDLNTVATHIINRKLIDEIGTDGFSLILHIHYECMKNSDRTAYFNNQELKAFLGINPQYHDSRVKRVREKLIELGLLQYTASHRNKGQYFTTFNN